VRGGFLTWAAKPRVRKSPKPRKIYFSSELSRFHYYGEASSKVPWDVLHLDNFRSQSYGRVVRVSDSKKPH
jgi:hypothetical protein